MKPLNEQVRDIVASAMKKNPDAGVAIEKAFGVIARNPVLLHHVFLPFAESALRPFLDDEQDQSRSGAPVSCEALIAPVGGRDQRLSEAHPGAVPAAKSPRVSAAAIGRVHRDLLMNEIMPNGKRFRYCTKRDLEALGPQLGRIAHRCIAVAARLKSPTDTPAGSGITENDLRLIDAEWNGV